MKSRILACFCVCVLYLAPLLVFGQVPPAPVITGFTPTAQCSGGVVTIVGQNFINVEMVRFGRVNAAVFVVNRTGDTIRAFVDRNGTSGAISVITSLVATSTSANFTFLRPNSEVQTHLTAVRPFPLSVRETDVEATLVGTFAVSCTNPTGSVSLTKAVGDSILRTSIIPVIRSETERTFTVPQAFIRTTGNIVCTFNDGIAAPVTTTLTVTVRQPRITSLSPSSTIATAQAFQLTINGEGFWGNMQVAFGGTPITIFSTSETRIVVNIPGWLNVEGLWEVAVVMSQTETIKNTYRISRPLDGPAISNIRLSSSPTGQGLLLTILGDNFATGATVHFGGHPLIIQSVSSGVIIALLPNRLLNGTYVLIVTNPDGQFALQPNYGMGVNENELHSGSLYPNPVHETVTIETDNPTPRTVTLILRNTLGQELMRLTKEMPAGRVTTPLEVGRFPAGTYFLEIQSGSERVVERLVKC